MFRVEFAPDAVCQLEHLMLLCLESGGRTEAYDFLNKLELSIAALKAKPLSEGIHMNGIPKRYRVKNVVSGIFLIYQIDEESSCVRVDGMLEDHTEIP